eukprot:464182_1
MSSKDPLIKNDSTADKDYKSTIPVKIDEIQENLNVYIEKQNQVAANEINVQADKAESDKNVQHTRAASDNLAGFADLVTKEAKQPKKDNMCCSCDCKCIIL